MAIRSARVCSWGVVAAAVITVASAGPVLAQSSGIIEIPLDTVVRTDPGVRTLLISLAVPDDLVGQDCVVESRAENNSSVHPGNDLIAASGNASVLLPDVEGSPGKLTTAATALVLGPQVSITLVMGPDGVFSAGATAFVVVSCAPTSTTTTSTTTTSTTTTSTTTTSTTTTSTTTSTVPGSTSTVPGSTSTSTTSTTTVAGPTTSIAGPTSSVVEPPTTSPPTNPPELAFTGPTEVVLLAIAGVVLLGLGSVTLTAGQSRRGDG